MNKNKSNQHVVKHDLGWAVKKAGSKKASSIHKTQKDAIKQAKETAQNNKSEVLIHNREGKIRERNSYGNDPYPPKG